MAESKASTWKEFRSEYKRQGIVHYSTGKPCKNGHMAMRLVSNGMCVACSEAAGINWKARHPERWREVRQKAWERWEAKYPEKARESLRRSNIKSDHKRLEKQFGVAYDPQSCEICGSTRRPGLDHDHATGKFRGWLCKKCNMGLGMANDSVERLQKMIAYLLKDR